MAKGQTPPEENKLAPAKKKKTKLVILLASLVLLITLGGAGYWSYSKYLQTGVTGANTVVHGTLGGEEIPAQGEPISLEPFLVNLADPGGRRYLKIKIELEALNKETVDEIEKSMPKIRDAIILLLCSKTYAELASPAGKQRLRQEILAKLRTLPGGPQVMGAYFTEFVSQ